MGGLNKAKVRMSVTGMKGGLGALGGGMGAWGKVRNAVQSAPKPSRTTHRVKRLDPGVPVIALARDTAEAVEQKKPKDGGALAKSVRKAKAAIDHHLADNPQEQTIFMVMPGSTPEERDALIKGCQLKVFKKGDSVVHGPDDAFTILLSGSLGMANWAGQKRTKTQGAIFDRMLFSTSAIEDNTATMVLSQDFYATLEPEVAIPLKRVALKQLVIEGLDSMLEMGQFPWFKELTGEQQDQFVDSLETVSLNTGDVAAEHGKSAPFLLVLKGELTLVLDQDIAQQLGPVVGQTSASERQISGQPVERQRSKRQMRETKKDLRQKSADKEEGIGAGMIFGTKQLMAHGQGSTIEGTLAAACDTTVMRVTHEMLTSMYKQPLSKVLKTNKIKMVLRSSSLFQVLEEDQMDALCEAFSERLYTNNQVIIREGEEAKEFFVIQTGAVAICIGDRVIRTINCWDYFGERACITGDPCSATCKAVGSCLCLVLRLDSFIMIARSLRQALEDRIHLQDMSVEVDDLVSNAILGRGWFGFTVFAHLEQDSFTGFAVKCVKKKGVSLKKERENLVLERQLGMDLNHRFIVSFVRTMQDANSIYMLFEFLDGGDLFQLMRTREGFNTWECQFYIGSIVLALEYLHGCHIMHRDIRPENVLLDSFGYPKISGFTCCRRVDPPTSSKVRGPGLAHTASVIISANSAPDFKTQKTTETTSEVRRTVTQNSAVQTAWGHETDKKKKVGGLRKALGFTKAAKPITEKAVPTDLPPPKQESGGKATTICGAPEYLAPEILLGRGYGPQVDWWALGIIAFELICGNRPFGEASTKNAKLFSEILSAEIAIPEKGADLAGPCLISRLLQRDPKLRITTSLKTQTIRNHAYFRDFDWNALSSHRMEPPIQPDTSEVRSSWEEHPDVKLTRFNPGKKRSSNPATPRLKQASSTVSAFFSESSVATPAPDVDEYVDESWAEKF